MVLIFLIAMAALLFFGLAFAIAFLILFLPWVWRMAYGTGYWLWTKTVDWRVSRSI